GHTNWSSRHGLRATRIPSARLTGTDQLQTLGGRASSTLTGKAGQPGPKSSHAWGMDPHDPDEPPRHLVDTKLARNSTNPGHNDLHFAGRVSRETAEYTARQARPA